MGICFDVCIVTIPLMLIKNMMLKSQERTVLMLLFSANMLATTILIAGLTGIWYTSDPIKFPDYTWLETIYIIMQNLEMLAYAIGASTPGKLPPPRFLARPVNSIPFAHKANSFSSTLPRHYRQFWQRCLLRPRLVLATQGLQET